MAIMTEKTKQVHERKLPWFRSSHLSKSASVVPVHNSVRQIIVIVSQMEWVVSIKPVTPSFNSWNQGIPESYLSLAECFT